MLKKTLLVSTIALVLIACGGGSDDKTIPTAKDLESNISNSSDSADMGNDINDSAFDTDASDINLTEELNNGFSEIDTNETETPDLNTSLKKGYLIDAPISGVSYACGLINGTTTDEGEFSCNNTPVEFTIGSYNLGTLDEFTADDKVYPQDLLEGVKRGDTDDERVVEMIRLLQSLDDDGDISEMIKIDQETIDKFDQFGDATNGLELDELVGLADKDLVNKDDAIEHLTDNLLNNLLEGE